ncbi:MAG TPA: MarR family transcriptional regulator [Jiangellaceae bacterium]|nr:MarR family transcriptional regulator [Jiangellaceae bacterium]
MDPLSEFVEDAGLYFEGLGLSRTAGRIMGWLLVVEPDGDAPQFCEALGVAKSSVSVALRRLEQAGLVQKFRVSGMRRDRFRLAEDVFGRAFRTQMAALNEFVALADRGLSIIGDDPARRSRLENMREMYAFMSARFPQLLDEWEASR